MAATTTTRVEPVLPKGAAGHRTAQSDPRFPAPLPAAVDGLLRLWALGLIAVAESFWVKKALTLSPAELAELSVWLTLPWTVKMVFGELVDAVPILGSQRRAYVFIGAAFIASGMVLLAGAAAHVRYP